MLETTRLAFFSEKTSQNLMELWQNCFEGYENYEHMHKHVPMMYRVPNQAILSNALKNNKRCWLISRIKEKDIIGFLVYGDFIPGLPNNIGFNIGRDYTKKGYAVEALKALLDHLKSMGINETFGHCLETNIGSIKTMEACGFINQGKTGRILDGNHELKFKYSQQKFNL